MNMGEKARGCACLRFLMPIAVAVGCWMTASGAQADARLDRTEWFRRAGYGLFVHYLATAETAMIDPASVNSDCRQRSWNECVDAFDVEGFADSVRRTGAGYVFFTVCQGSRYLAAPNEEYDKWFGFKPGEACARRDLIADLADALKKRNIPLMLYYTGDGPNCDPECRAKGGFKSPIPMDWVEHWAKVLECYAVRYGDRVKGWWIDGCYVNNGGYGYTPEKLRLYERAIRKGNPDALIAFNRAEDIEKPCVDPYMSFQDFTSGEKYGLCFFPPVGGRIADGEQWHILTPLGSWWGRPGVKKATRELADYLYAVTRDGGVVTLDVMCYWDGSIERSQVNTLAGVRSRMAALRKSAAAHADNLAYMRPARCLSLRGTELPMQLGCRDSAFGATDGDSTTSIMGSMEWPWQIEVDLGVSRTFSRVNVRYKPGCFATDYRLSVSDTFVRGIRPIATGIEEPVRGANDKAWTVASSGANDNPSGTEIRLDRPVTARYIRFAALKPNGPNQRGGQMGISEIEVYEH